ncbi:ABC-three component system protein [Lysinibacillus sp. NPDC093216]|uniref:ABC-three component system protein n=1 Tax=Lysinibacillus sp. NPDC093216 TaxID=3390576 RepID=UPI003D04014E
MNRSKHFDDIMERITVLFLKIETNGTLNLLHFNIHAEPFFRDFLNKLLNLNLINANNLSQNIEAIDLIDEENKVIIQVTSSCTKEKVNSTLEKSILKEYKERDFKLRFLFIKKPSSSLKNNKFDNPNNIKFNPKEDFLDRDFIARKLMDLEIERLVEIKEFVDLELRTVYDSLKIISNLTMLINILTERDWSIPNQPQNLHEFNINKKINHNDLELMKRRINKYKVYYSKLETIYREFDLLGVNKSMSVFQKLGDFYDKELIKNVDAPDSKYKSSDIFLGVISRVKTQILSSENYIEMPDEELDLCVSIIVVDAFIRCEIFENPEGYTYVTT